MKHWGLRLLDGRFIEKTNDPIKRFFQNVLLEKTLDENSCWPWLGYVSKQSGYGRICIDYKTIQAHVFAWETFVSSIPTGLLVCHSCDTRHCVNFVKHLFLGTHKNNTQDAKKKGRLATGERHGICKIWGDQLERLKSLNGQMTTVQASKLFGLSHQHISDIWSGKYRSNS